MNVQELEWENVMKKIMLLFLCFMTMFFVINSTKLSSINAEDSENLVVENELEIEGVQKDDESSKFEPNKDNRIEDDDDDDVSLLGKEENETELMY